MRAPLALCASLGAIACSTVAPSTLVYRAEYKLELVAVDRPVATDEYDAGRATVLLPEDNRYVYEDELLSAIFLARKDGIACEVENRTDRTIKIVWDEAAFIDADGSSGRLLHQGSTYVSAPQPPTVIPSGTRVTDALFPAKRVRYREAVVAEEIAIPGGWDPLPLVVPVVDIVTMEGGAEELPPANDTFRTQVEDNQGKRYGLLLAIESLGITSEYIFWFEVVESRISGPQNL